MGHTPSSDPGAERPEVGPQEPRRWRNAEMSTWVLPGKHTRNDGKSPYFMGKSTISSGPFHHFQ